MPDLIHIIFNGGSRDESQGLVSLRSGTWLFYNWGRFSGHDANAQAGVQTLGIVDEDFRLLLGDGDDPQRCCDLANWDHVAELLTCPAFWLDERLRGERIPADRAPGGRSRPSHSATGQQTGKAVRP
jgi:hypothetical protein